MWARCKKLSLSVIALSLVTTGLGLFIVPAAQADNQGAFYTWVDVATIIHGTQVFKATTVDGRGSTNDFDVYTLQGDPDLCADTIQLNTDSQHLRTSRLRHSTDASNNFFVDNGNNDKDDNIQVPNDPETVTLNTKTHATTSLTSNSTACTSKSSKVTVFGGSAFAKTMAENADGTISMLGSSRSGGYKFTYDTTANTFIRNITDNCKDTLDVTEGSDTAKLTVRVQQHAGTSSSYAKEEYLTDDYRHYPFVHQLDYSAPGPGDACWVAQVATITLSAPYVKPVTGAISTTNNGTTSPSGTAAGSGGTNKKDDCASASGAYAWLLCPAVEKASDLITGIYTNFIEKLLTISPLDTSPTNNTYGVWKAFVNLANVLFVLAFIGIIFGTVMNLDAYTVKKALPRLVIAAVAVQLSYFACGVLIDISNIFGDGLLTFIQNAAASGTVVSPGAANGTTANVISYGLLSIGLLYGGALILLGPVIGLLILGLAISVITFVVTLLIRKLLIIALIILAPIAIVAWILPNTESLFKLWKTNFLKLLFIYPIMSILIGSAYVVQAASHGGNFVDQLTGGVAPIIAFIMMPAVFKMSGKAMGLAGKGIGKIGGGINSKAQGSQRAKNMASDKKAKGLDRANNATTSFGRAAGRAQAGFGFGRTPKSGAAQARLNTALAGQDKLADDAAARQLKDMDVNTAKPATATSPAVPAGEGLQFATQSIGSKTSSGQVVTKANQKAAIAKILANKDMKALEQVKTSFDSRGDTGMAEYKQLTQASFSEIRTLSPDLVAGGGEKSYDSLSAEQILNLSAEGREKLVARMASSGGAAAKINADNAFKIIQSSPTLKGKLNAAHRASFDPGGTIFK
jgi:hypothetical protein